MKGKNVLGWVLILFGSFSLIVGWPWGALVGAILILSGVLALRPYSHRPNVAPPPQPAEQSTEPPAVQGVSERLLEEVKALQSRDEAVPEEMMNQLQHLMTVQNAIKDDTMVELKHCIDFELDAVFRRYDGVISKSRNRTVDLGAIAQNFRHKLGLPAHGPVLGHECASEELNLVLTRIEELNGKVPIPESLFFMAVCEGGNGTEANYLKERQKRGYCSLYENESHLEWSSNPGFYERQLQRRHNNILFAPPKRCVSRYDIYVARWLDQQERTSFMQQWHEFNQRWEETFGSSGSDTPMREVFRHTDAISWVRDLYALMDKVFYMDNKMAQILQRFYQIAWSEAYAFLSSADAAACGRSPEELQELYSEEFMLDFEARRIMRLPDNSDLVPALLSEGIETIDAAVSVLQKPVLEDLRKFVSQMMEESPEVKALLLQQQMKLVALGILDLQPSETVQ